MCVCVQCWQNARTAISQKWCMCACACVRACVHGCVCACMRECIHVSIPAVTGQIISLCHNTHTPFTHTLTPRGNLESPNVLIYFIKRPLSVFEILIKHMYLLNVSCHREYTLIVWMCRCAQGFECFDPLRMRQMCWINQQLATISLFSHACKYEAALMTTWHLVSSNGHVRSH